MAVKDIFSISERISNDLPPKAEPCQIDFRNSKQHTDLLFKNQFIQKPYS